ncbi:hypothetical protein EC988_006459, partial [Linderina pennispora]
MVDFNNLANMATSAYKQYQETTSSDSSRRNDSENTYGSQSRNDSNRRNDDDNSYGSDRQNQGYGNQGRNDNDDYSSG